MLSCVCWTGRPLLWCPSQNKIKFFISMAENPMYSSKKSRFVKKKFLKLKLQVTSNSSQPPRMVSPAPLAHFSDPRHFALSLCLFWHLLGLLQIHLDPQPGRALSEWHRPRESQIWQSVGVHRVWDGRDVAEKEPSSFLLALVTYLFSSSQSA